MPGEHLDLTSELAAGQPPPSARPFLGLHFTCCRVYGRIYLIQDGSAFAGHCPRCGAAVRLEVSDDGQPGRFFAAG